MSLTHGEENCDQRDGKLGGFFKDASTSTSSCFPSEPVYSLDPFSIVHIWIEAPSMKPCKNIHSVVVLEANKAKVLTFICVSQCPCLNHQLACDKFTKEYCVIQTTSIAFRNPCSTMNDNVKGYVFHCTACLCCDQIAV